MNYLKRMKQSRQTKNKIYFVDVATSRSLFLYYIKTTSKIEFLTSSKESILFVIKTFFYYSPD